MFRFHRPAEPGINNRNNDRFYNSGSSVDAYDRLPEELENGAPLPPQKDAAVPARTPGVDSAGSAPANTGAPQETPGVSESENHRECPPACDPVSGKADAPQRDEDTAQGKHSHKEAEPLDQSAIDREFTGKAADPAEYEIYQHAEAASAGETVRLYAASRIGLGHLHRNAPCQDACAYHVIPHGLLLLNADGISACDYGHHGARLACRAASERIEALSRSTSEENAFIRALLSTEFYRSIRGHWLTLLKEDWETTLRKEEPFSLMHYGTTLLIGVITENWYVTLNLGDGQILLFNDDECLRLRMTEKDSPAPRSLIYSTYLEDVQRGVWPRKQYRGILLTTDGLYDRITRLSGQADHRYALQAARRFEEHREPFQPFVYTGLIDDVERTIDVSRQRSASDDFSIVMAVMPGCDTTGADMANEIRRHVPGLEAVQLLRRVGRMTAFLALSEGRYSIILVSPAERTLPRSPRLDDFTAGAVRLWKCGKEESWTSDGMRFNVYRLEENTPVLFLEECLQRERFHSLRQYHKVDDTYDPATEGLLRIADPLVGMHIVDTFRTLQQLGEHLARHNLQWNEMAASWILLQEDEDHTLLIPPETICESGASEGRAPWSLSLSDLFPGMIGWLNCDGERMPVFDPGDDPIYPDCYFFDAPPDDEENSRFFQVHCRTVNGRRVFGLHNISKYHWEYINASGKQAMVAPGQTVQFADGCSITPLRDGKKQLVCRTHLL